LEAAALRPKVEKCSAKLSIPFDARIEDPDFPVLSFSLKTLGGLEELTLWDTESACKEL